MKPVIVLTVALADIEAFLQCHSMPNVMVNRLYQMTWNMTSTDAYDGIRQKKSTPNYDNLSNYWHRVFPVPHSMQTEAKWHSALLDHVYNYANKYILESLGMVYKTFKCVVKKCWKQFSIALTCKSLYRTLFDAKIGVSWSCGSGWLG